MMSAFLVLQKSFFVSRMLRVMLLPVAKYFPNKFKIVHSDCICSCNKKLFGFILRLFDFVYVVPS